MHGSSSTSASRPRQRTFTSCTECRRRKQRCNQAKDRPCNNCSRRYPPVLCAYESTSPPPSHEHGGDYRDVIGTTARESARQVQGRTENGSNPAYQQTPPSSAPTNAAADRNYYNASYGYHAPPEKADYRTYESGASPTQALVASTSGEFLSIDAYYQPDQMSYAIAPSQDYYSSSTQQGNWLSPAGNPGVFVGSGVSDYFYVCEETNQPRTTRS